QQSAAGVTAGRSEGLVSEYAKEGYYGDKVEAQRRSIEHRTQHALQPTRNNDVMQPERKNDRNCRRLEYQRAGDQPLQPGISAIEAELLRKVEGEKQQS